MAQAEAYPHIIVSMPGDTSRWGLVELQGQIETRDQVPFNGMHIGDLHFNSKGVPSLIVGHHLLTGKIQSMEKPFAILKKRNPIQDMNYNESALQVQNNVVHNTEYEIVALISKKIIFNNRPKPIITKTGIKKV